MLLPNDEQDAALIEIDGSNAGRSAWSAWSAVSSMCDVAPSNHAGGGARNAWGRKGERDGGRRSRGERRKISSKREKGKNCQNPGFQYHSSLNRIVQY